MSRRLAWSLLTLLLLALLVGTQMPGAWRSAAESSLHAPFPVSSLAHFVLFAAMAGLLAWRPLAWPAWRVMVWALALALLTEALQFFALDRHPRWLDVIIDLAGTVTALAVVFFAASENTEP